MSYEQGRELGDKAAKAGLVASLTYLIAGLVYDPSRALYWFLTGAGVYISVAVIAWLVVYITWKRRGEI